MCVCMFLVSVGILRIGTLCMLYVYMYCILDKRVLDVWCVCDKCVVCGEHMHLICVVFIGVVHLNGVCGVCDVGDICVVHVWCVCVNVSCLVTLFSVWCLWCICYVSVLCTWCVCEYVF